MKYTLCSSEKKILRQIAGFYGCKVRFGKCKGGYFGGEYIYVGEARSSLKWILSVFCHELGHFVNWKTGKYPLYHNPKSFHRLPAKFKHFGSFVNYALKAEIYTEKVGKQLCREWFPDIEYQTVYRNTVACREFLTGYYMGDK